MDKDERSDAELLGAWRQGDKRAGDLLFHRHYPALFGFFANTASGNRDDLVQRTFLACVEGRDRIREDAAFRGYLLRVATRELYRSIRERVAAQRFDPSVSSLHDVDPSPSSLVVRRHQLQLLVEALRRIPLEFQVVLELYHLHGYSAPDVAEILEIPEGTVRSRVKRGLGHLAERVGELDVGHRATSGEQVEAALAELGAVLARGAAGDDQPS